MAPKAGPEDVKSIPGHAAWRRTPVLVLVALFICVAVWLAGFLTQAPEIESATISVADSNLVEPIEVGAPGTSQVQGSTRTQAEMPGPAEPLPPSPSPASKVWGFVLGPTGQPLPG